jgi:hypothetical protein
VRLGSLKLPPIDAPPATWTGTDPGTITATYTAGTPDTLNLSPTNNPSSTECAVIRMRAPVSPGTTITKHRVYTRQIEYAPTTPPWDLADSYQNLYGNFKTGWNIVIQLFYVDLSSGHESPRRVTSTVIT